MQLSPSTIPLDSSLLGLLLPGSAPAAAAPGVASPANTSGGASVAFEQLLPGQPKSGQPSAESAFTSFASPVPCAPEGLLGFPMPGGAVRADVGSLPRFVGGNGDSVESPANAVGVEETNEAPTQPAAAPLEKKRPGATEAKSRELGGRNARTTQDDDATALAAPNAELLALLGMLPPAVDSNAVDLSVAPKAEAPQQDGDDAQTSDVIETLEAIETTVSEQSPELSARGQSPRQALTPRSTYATDPKPSFAISPISTSPVSPLRERVIPTAVQSKPAIEFGAVSETGFGGPSEFANDLDRNPAEAPRPSRSMSTEPAPSNDGTEPTHGKLPLSDSLFEKSTPRPAAVASFPSAMRLPRPAQLPDREVSFGSSDLKLVERVTAAPASPDSAVSAAHSEVPEVSAPVTAAAENERIADAAPVLPENFRGPIRTSRVSRAGAAEANFAEPADKFRVNFAPRNRDNYKTFVSTEEEGLTPRTKALGIDVAKPAEHMPTRVPFTSTPHPASEYAAVAVGAVRESATSSAEPHVSAAPETAATAHQAVEAVLRAVDHVATREQHSVNLHFSVGESDLKVRVEMHADEVRTTFSTDSAELRSALSHEWQAIAHSGGDRGVRIASATFTTSDQPAGNTFSGDASSRDRQNPHHAPREAHDAFVPSRATFGVRSNASSSEARIERATTPIAHAGSRLLHTLA